MSLAERADLVARLSLKDEFSGPLGRAEGKMRGFSKTASAVGRDLGHGVRNTARNIEHLAFAGAALAAGGGVAAVKWAGDFQAGMNTINSVALATPAALGKAGEGIRSLFRETGQSMEDLQAAEYDLVSAGIKLGDAQAGVNTAVHLGIGALGTTAEAVDVLTTAINSYNLKAADGTVATSTWARISDELAQAVADGKVKLTEIAASYAQVAPVAAQAGVKTGEIAAALGYLTAKGNPAAETLTQMNRAIIELSKPKGDLAKVLKKLGSTGPDLIKKNGLAGALEIIRVQAAKMKIPFIDLFGRVEAYKFALQTTGDNAAGFTAELDRIAKSAGMTNKQFEARAQGLNYNLGLLKANVQDAGITIGTALLPKLIEMSQRAAGFLRTHAADIKSFATDLAAGFSKAADYAMSIDWASIGNAIKGLANVGKALAEGFLAMPTEAKELILGLYGLNKLSGGAVVNIGVDLFKGTAGTLFQQLLGRGSPANPMFVVPVGGGLGGGGGPGGAIVGGGGSLLGALGIAGLIIGAAIPIGEALRKATGSDFGSQSQDAHQRAIEDMQRRGVAPAGPPPTPAWVPSATAKEASDVAIATGIRGGNEGHQENLGLRTAIREGLIAGFASSHPMSPDERDAFNRNQAATNRARDAIETARIAQVSETGRVKSAVDAARDGIVGGLRSLHIPTPIVNVNVKTTVTSGSIARAVTNTKRYSTSHLRTGGFQEYG